MDYAAAAEALMRRRLLEEMYDRMTDEEKKLFVRMALEDRRSDEILRAVQENRRHLERLEEQEGRGRWLSSFGSDVAANVLTGTGAWLLWKLLSGR